MECNIDFIKWKFEKAGEPFKVNVYPNCTTVEYPSREHALFIENFEKVCPDYVKSFLLQRAIESVNRTYFNEGSAVYPWIIQNYSHGFSVYKGASSGPEKRFSFDWPCKTEDIDQSKESALLYIYEQETK